MPRPPDPDCPVCAGAGVLRSTDRRSVGPCECTVALADRVRFAVVLAGSCVVVAALALGWSPW